MRHHKGFVIVTALVIAATLSLMVGGFSLYIFYMNQVAKRYVDSVKAYYLAYAGIEYARTTYYSNGKFSITDSADTIAVNCNNPLPFTQGPGDATHDGMVDIEDFQLLSNSYGTQSGDPRYNAEVDFNKDGFVNSSDFSILVDHWGETYYTPEASNITYIVAIQSIAKINGVTRILLCEEESNPGTRSLRLDNTVIKWR